VDYTIHGTRCTFGTCDRQQRVRAAHDRCAAAELLSIGSIEVRPIWKSGCQLAGWSECGTPYKILLII
jgi:hypothetical protein